MKNTVHKVIPAPPGYSLVSMCLGDKKESNSLTFAPVVALVVEYTVGAQGEVESTSAYPVTFEVTDALSGATAIRYPDGRTLFPENCEYPAGADAAVLDYLERDLPPTAPVAVPAKVRS